MRFVPFPLMACGLATAALLWPPSAAASMFSTTNSGSWCAIAPDVALPPGKAIACQGRFAQAPQPGAGPVINSDGTFHWEVVQLDESSPTTIVNYGQSYHYGDWSMYPDEAGTRYVNDHTGHGLFVGSQSEVVYPF